MPADDLGARHERSVLDQGWEAARAAPSEAPGTWRSAQVPGTAAGALLAAQLWPPAEPTDLDAADWWFRTRFQAAAAEPGEEVVLRFEGLATVAEVFLNGELILTSSSMFVENEVEVGALLAGDNRLEICCRALAPLLAVPRKPRARWRTRLADGNLRFVRTSLFGRAPGFAAGPAPVGPWRPVVLERRRGLLVDELSLRPRLDGDTGVLAVRARVRSLGGASPGMIEVEAGGQTASLDVADGVASGELQLPGVARWWPHTHGEPVLHDVTLRIDGVDSHVGKVGFRTLEPGPEYDVDHDLFALRINGVDVFARGATWTPIDFVGLSPTPDDLRAALEDVREAGLNILRLPGTSLYESRVFHDLCDELGILVWQDFMFANFDYPIDDPDFRELVEREARGVLRTVVGRPSLVVLCGNSEVEQQVAMLGLDPSLGRGELFGELLPRLAREAGSDAIYVPSAPSGGELPFRSNRGVAHYFGVGGYRRGLDDARRSEVGFAAECLAIANVPDERSLEAAGLAGVTVDDPRWKAGVPGDVGADWDFDDVRDHYLRELYAVDPEELRRSDLARYLDLSRAVSGEVMAEVFGEWRRGASPCHGGIVLWLRDLVPGAGWGIVDSSGAPKAAYHHLRRALAPVAVWMTDEGLGGIDVHLANDRPEPVAARLRVTLFRDLEHRVENVEEALVLPAHSVERRSVEGVLGRFADAAHAYRFGPPGHDVVVASLERDGSEGPELLSQAFRFPTGRPVTLETAAELGLEAVATSTDQGPAIRLTTRRLVHGLRIVTDGGRPADDAFSLEPGGERTVLLLPAPAGGAEPTEGFVTALNLVGDLPIAR